MIEIRNITKIYHSKTGTSVKALDNVSVTFPERGMVFILGKSGSGKSTLLNVIGGLDGCDSGEFIIKGKSSKDFVGSDFDAYRNTFIGFIFQEYNILDDFSVGANIGLALELQGKKATNDKINEILRDVDLLDYAKRKPNELSGGQKQRVAIARALVKDPEIIMADEPTGALDSNTGKQIFDTLKELSKTKLVIVVSHDVDFAEKYGDRIIEMKDGKIFRDVTKHEVEAVQISDGILQMSDNLLRIERGYLLTPADLALINQYLAKQNAEILISGDARLNDSVRSEAGISQNNCTAVFNETDPEKDVKVESYDGKKTKFIKSRLPMKNAIKIGGSSLGHKKFRLVMTIFLSLIAFALFGFADTLGGYDKITAATESIIDSHVQNASFSLSLKETHTYGDDSYEYFNSAALNENDIKMLSQKSGLSFVPVFNGSTDPHYSNIPISSNMLDSSNISSTGAYTGSLYGFTAMDESDIRKLGLSITGQMPADDDEIAISKFMYEQFNYTGFKDAETGDTIDAGSLTAVEGDRDSIIGKSIKINMNGWESTFKVTAVIDTNFEYSRYQKYIPSTNASNTSTVPTETDTIVDMIMQRELQNTLRYGFHALGYVTDEAIDVMSAHMMRFGMMNEIGTYMNWNMEISIPDANGNANNQYFSKIARFDDVADMMDVQWIDDNGTLDENEILISKNNRQVNVETNISDRVQNIKLQVLGSDGDSYSADDSTLKEMLSLLFGKYADSVSDDQFNNYSYLVFNEEVYFSLNTAREFLANKYVREVLVENPDIIESEEFERYIIARYSDIERWNSSNISTEDKKNMAISAFTSAIAWGDAKSDCKEEWYSLGIKAVEDSAMDLYTTVTGQDVDFGASDIVIKITFWDKNSEIVREYSDYTVAGYFDDPNGNLSNLLVSDDIYAMHEEYVDEQGFGTTTVTPHDPGIYAFAIAPMPTDRAAIEKLVNLNYEEMDGLKFQMQNQVMDTLNSFNDFIEMGAKVFLYIGIGFAVFSGLMLMNFISVSISYKRREIGILRAVGARSSDVFKIFFSEAAMIALINYVLALAATIAGITVFNNAVRNSGVNVTLLNFGLRQIVLMLFVSLFVAAVASFLPVWNIARRKPVDAIKNK